MNPVIRNLWTLCILIVLLPTSAWAGSKAPVIAIIIDDLGHDRRSALRTATLPAPVTLAIMPHTPFAAYAAKQAIRHGQEVMLHLPMEAENGQHPGTGSIVSDMDEQQTREAVRAALKSVPDARGVNNHMGSRLSREHDHLAWIMAELREADRELYFVDSRTHPLSLGQHIAAWARLPNARRDVFLDSRPNDADFVRLQLDILAQRARQQGKALAIGHPHAETLEVLQHMLPQLEARGFRLVTVSEYIRLEH